VSASTTQTLKTVERKKASESNEVSTVYASAVVLDVNLSNKPNLAY